MPFVIYTNMGMSLEMGTCTHTEPEKIKVLRLTLLCFRSSKCAAMSEPIQEKPLFGREETELVSCVMCHIKRLILELHGH